MKHVITTPDGLHTCTMTGTNGTYRLFTDFDVKQHQTFTELLEKACRLEQWHRYRDNRQRFIIHLNKRERPPFLEALPEIMAKTLCSQQRES